MAIVSSQAEETDLENTIIASGKITVKYTKIVFCFVHSNKYSHFSIGKSTEQFWLSGTDQAQEGAFVWFSTGKPFTYNKCSCLQLYSIAPGKIGWNDRACSVQMYYVCEDKTCKKNNNSNNNCNNNCGCNDHSDGVVTTRINQLL